MGEIEGLLDLISRITLKKEVNMKIFQEALTHPSLSLGRGLPANSYQRLEFLGDSVLLMVISEALFKIFPSDNEGDLAKKRARLIEGRTISLVAREINLGKYLKMSAGEKQSGGEGKNSNLEDALEALIGAIYLDQGIDCARNFILHFWYDFLYNHSFLEQLPSKTELQEWCHRCNHPLPIYHLISTLGPSHQPEFIVEIEIRGSSYRGIGGSRKEAEQRAAAVALEELRDS